MTKQRLLFPVAAVNLLVALLALSPLRAQQAGSGFLKVKATPGRAGVFLDGKYVGPAANFARARKYAAAAGEHELALREPRYQEFKTTVKIEPGKTTTVSQSLQASPLAKPPFGKLKVAGFEKYAAVYINGAYMGHADEFDGPGEALLLNPGDYEVRITSQSGNPLVEQKATIARGQVATVRAK